MFANLAQGKREARHPGIGYIKIPALKGRQYFSRSTDSDRLDLKNFTLALRETASFSLLMVYL